MHNLSRVQPLYQQGCKKIDQTLSKQKRIYTVIASVINANEMNTMKVTTALEQEGNPLKLIICRVDRIKS